MPCQTPNEHRKSTLSCDPHCLSSHPLLSTYLPMPPQTHSFRNPLALCVLLWHIGYIPIYNDLISHKLSNRLTLSPGERIRWKSSSAVGGQGRTRRQRLLQLIRLLVVVQDERVQQALAPHLELDLVGLPIALYARRGGVFALADLEELCRAREEAGVSLVVLGREIAHGELGVRE